ncbi:hypothetical protein NPIL_653101, partial [Nephila pilipes]
MTGRDFIGTANTSSSSSSQGSMTLAFILAALAVTAFASLHE